MWTLTTAGDLPDEHELRLHDASMPAWDDYPGRILELEVHGFSQETEAAAEYGRPVGLRTQARLRTDPRHH